MVISTSEYGSYICSSPITNPCRLAIIDNRHAPIINWLSGHLFAVPISNFIISFGNNKNCVLLSLTLVLLHSFVTLLRLFSSQVFKYSKYGSAKHFAIFMHTGVPITIFVSRWVKITLVSVTKKNMNSKRPILVIFET